MSPLGYGIVYILTFSACLIGIALMVDHRIKKNGKHKDGQAIALEQR